MHNYSDEYFWQLYLYTFQVVQFSCNDKTVKQIFMFKGIQL